MFLGKSRLSDFDDDLCFVSFPNVYVYKESFGDGNLKRKKKRSKFFWGKTEFLGDQ